MEAQNRAVPSGVADRTLPQELGKTEAERPVGTVWAGWMKTENFPLAKSGYIQKVSPCSTVWCHCCESCGLLKFERILSQFLQSH